MNSRDAKLCTPATPEQIEHSSDDNSNPTHRGVAKYGRGAKAWISEDALRRKLERQKHFTDNFQAAGKESVGQQLLPPKSGRASPSVRYITIDDISFQVINGGSKLQRSPGRPLPEFEIQGTLRYWQTTQTFLNQRLKKQ